MCGIAGIVGARKLAPGDPDRCRQMGSVLQHRGPDEHGVHLDDQAALAHRRLSIIDLASGQQPLCNEDRSVWITYNGEIYNHGEIRRTLEAAGHTYRTKSDTETIVHAYEEWGDHCVEHFRGMFAFGLWDSRRSRLLLARDRLGIKPLYWALHNDRLLFASEIKAILESGLVAPRANEQALPELLSTRYLSNDETMFVGIRKLLPGHLLCFEDGRVRTERYWDLPTAVDADGNGSRAGSDAQVVGRFRELLEESVRLRLMSDVPLGVFLSGGLDSSVIAAIMARQVNRPIETFSVAFADRAFNELEYSRQVANAIGAVRHEVVVSEQDFFDAWPRLVWHEDEPIAHPSSVPLYFVSQLAKPHVTVVLTGEGSDELLAGYGKYLRAVWNWRLGSAYARFVPDAFRRTIASEAVPRLPSRIRRFAGRSFLGVEATAEAHFFDNFAAIPLQAQRRLLAPALAAHATAAEAYAHSRAWFDRPGSGHSLLDRLLYTDIKTYLVELLMKQDQMSMAASIESRVPFLDHKLVEYVSTLPDEWKLSGRTTKRILREAARDILPRSILERPKMGFPVPFGQWLRGPGADTAREVLLDRRSRQRGLLDTTAVSRLIDDHAASRTNAGDILWSLMNLELWYRTYIDGDGIQSLNRVSPVRTMAPRTPSQEMADQGLARPA